MTAVNTQELTIETGSHGSVSALLIRPARASACYVFAHGAGAGMTHPFMAAVAEGLAERGVATLRYQFPYMEKGSKRPDSPAVAHAAVRAAAAEAARCCPGLPLIAGGKSFGGRMTSQAQAAAPLAGVRGLAFFGFPLHPAGKPSSERAKHLGDIVSRCCSCRAPATASRNRVCSSPSSKAWSAGDAASGQGCRSFLPCAGAFGPQRQRSDGRNPRCVRGLGRRDRSPVKTVVGSSSNSTRGPDRMAGPIASILRSTPDKVPATWSIRWPSFGKISSTRLTASLSRLVSAPTARLSRTESRPNTGCCCGTRRMMRRNDARHCPARLARGGP